MTVAGWVIVIVLAVLLATAVGAAVWLGTERGRAQREAGNLRVEAATLKERLDAADAARRQYEAELERRLAQFTEVFKSTIDASAGKALESASTQFLRSAGETFQRHAKPISDALTKTEAKLAEIEKERVGAYSSLTEQIKNVAGLNEALKKETANLVNALRKPEVRGRWGEIQLRRVIELAGMRDYCDFAEQESVRDEEGALLRPDVVVKLPNDRCVVIDAKTNIEAYVEATQADDAEQTEAHLDRFARHVAEQAAALADKRYWSQFNGSAEFVVMFIPGDQFIDAALRRRPGLIDLAAERGVILASPSTLIGLLKAVHVGWREKILSDRANELFALGRELHQRAAVAFEHVEALGGAIRKTADLYGKFVGSVERNMMPTLRKFEEAGARSDKALPELSPPEVAVREFRAPGAPAQAADASEP